MGPHFSVLDAIALHPADRRGPQHVATAVEPSNSLPKDQSLQASPLAWPYQMGPSPSCWAHCARYCDSRAAWYGLNCLSDGCCIQNAR